MDYHTALLKLIRQVSYREGDFTLASGQKSNFYVNLKATTLHAEGAWLIGKLIVERLQSEGIKVDAVGGMTLGADPIATAVSIVSRDDGLNWPAFIVRKESKGHGTDEYVEGTENLKEGAHLVVLEDVTTTGKTAMTAVERLEAVGYQPTVLFTIVDRETGAEKIFEDKGMRYLSLVTLSEIQNFKG